MPLVLNKSGQHSPACHVLKAVLVIVFVVGYYGTICAQHPSIGGFNVYYGHLHNHTSYSDGTGTPAQAYDYARNTAGLDFFGLADHSDGNGCTLTATEWADLKAQANAFNTDGVFTTFYGFEWTNYTFGHVAVVNADTFTNFAVSNSFSALMDWLSTRDVVAFFNHPGRDDSKGQYSYNGTVSASLKFVGMELWNRTDGFSVYYDNTGSIPDDKKGLFDEALSRGWMIGASGSADDHWGTWGTGQNYRMAILADNLTRSSLFDALKARRFYSTLESDIRLSFKMDGQEMGSALPAGSYTIQIQAADGGGEAFTRVVLYNKNHDRLKTWRPETSSFSIQDNITTSAGDYFYVKVLQADSSATSGQAISSPIFVTSLQIDGTQSIHVCPDVCVTLENNVIGGTAPYTYHWSPSTGLSSTNVSNPVACPENSTGYQVTVTDATGCSVTNFATVNILPIPGSAGPISGAASVCQGQFAVNYTLPAIDHAASYIWTLPDNAAGTSTINSISLNYGTSTHTSYLTVKGHNNCGDGDPSALAIRVNPCYSYTEHRSICDGDTYHWQGADYSLPGIYTVNYKTAAGCDSVYTLHLTVNPVYSFAENHRMCKGEVYRWQGSDYRKDGSYAVNYQTISGCDSIYTLDLMVDSVDTGITLSGNTISVISPADGYQWINCDNDFTPFPGHVLQSFTATKYGNYAVKITRGLCSDTSVCIRIMPTGITASQEIEGLSLYPNPVSDELFIEIKDNSDITFFEILNTTGQIVFTGMLTEKTVVQTGSFAPGLYVIKFTNGKTVAFNKVIKE